MKNRRLSPEVRAEQLLEHAIEQAKVTGLAKLTREAIAQRAGVAPGLISIRLGTMINLRRDILRHAVKRAILPLIAEGLMAKDPVAMKAPKELRQRAIVAAL